MGGVHLIKLVHATLIFEQPYSVDMIRLQGFTQVYENAYRLLWKGFVFDYQYKYEVAYLRIYKEFEFGEMVKRYAEMEEFLLTEVLDKLISLGMTRSSESEITCKTGLSDIIVNQSWTKVPYLKNSYMYGDTHLTIHEDPDYYRICVDVDWEIGKPFNEIKGE